MQIDLVTVMAEDHKGRWYKIDSEGKKRGIDGGIDRVHAGVAGNAEGFQSIPRLIKPDPKGRLYPPVSEKLPPT